MMPTEAQRILKDLMENAVSRGQVGSHTLLYGQPHLVRDTLFAAVAQVEGVVLRNPSILTLERVGDLAAVLTHLQSRNFLFIDHFHLLSTPSIELLPELMHFSLPIKVGHGSEMKEVYLRLPQFTVIAATSKPHLLPHNLKKCFAQQIGIEDSPPDSSSSVLS
ncbi:MAG: hypothetical protein ABI947_13365 [Chloroflexota bacterium]